MIKVKRRVLGLLVLFSLFQSCAIVKTKSSYDFNSKGKSDGLMNYYLPETLLDITVTTKVDVLYDNGEITSSSVPVSQSFDVAHSVIPDTDIPLSMRYRPYLFSEDYIKVEIDKDGLLKSLDVTSEDKTGAVFQKIGDALPSLIFSARRRNFMSQSVPEIQEFSRTFQIRYKDLLKGELTVNNTVFLVNSLKEAPDFPLDASFKIKIGQGTFTVAKNNSTGGLQLEWNLYKRI